MKKTVTAAALLLTLVCLVLAGCGAQAQEKTFEKAGMTITLTDRFAEKEHAAYTAYYESSDALVIALKEEFALFDQAGISTDITLAEYGEIVMLGNGVEATVEETDGVTYFVYEQQVNGKDFSYMATLHRGADAYWLVQFASETKDFEGLREQFITWAKTVTV